MTEGAHGGVRAGVLALSVLSDPLNARALLAVAPGPLRLTELREELGRPAQTTLRLHLKHLCDLGILTRCEQPVFPGAVDYGLGPAGTALLQTVEVLAAWLETSPGGPLSITDAAAGNAVKALMGGWTSNVLRVLAARPLTLTQLDRLIPAINYPTLERRTAAMRRAGQLVHAKAGVNGKPYKATRWLRLGVPPLAAAVAWELEWAHERVDHLRRKDFLAMLLLVVPLLEPPADASGTCSLLVDLGSEGDEEVYGVMITLHEGRLVSISTNVDGAEGWALASGLGWLEVLGGISTDALTVGGDRSLAGAVIKSLLKERTRRPADPHLHSHGLSLVSPSDGLR